MKKSFNSIYSTSRPIRHHKDLNSCHEVLVTENVDFEGRSIVTSSYKIDDPLHRYDGYRLSDFCIENQLAVGVQPKLAKLSPSGEMIDNDIRNANNLKFDENVES